MLIGVKLISGVDIFLCFVYFLLMFLFFVFFFFVFFFFFQAEAGIRVLVRSRGLGDVYKSQTHLIAISGLHIGLVASFVYLFVLYGLRLFRVSNVGPMMVSGFHLAHLAALFAAWGYGALAGYSVPTLSLIPI